MYPTAAASSALDVLRDKIWIINDQNVWSLYRQKSDVLLTLKRKLWWHLLNCWILDCKCTLCCYLDASHLWEVWHDLYEKTSFAHIEEFKLWSTRSWYWQLVTGRIPVGWVHHLVRIIRRSVCSKKVVEDFFMYIFSVLQFRAGSLTLVWMVSLATCLLSWSIILKWEMLAWGGCWKCCGYKLHWWNNYCVLLLLFSKHLLGCPL